MFNFGEVLMRFLTGSKRFEGFLRISKDFEGLRRASTRPRGVSATASTRSRSASAMALGAVSSARTSKDGAFLRSRKLTKCGMSRRFASLLFVFATP